MTPEEESQEMMRKWRLKEYREEIDRLRKELIEKWYQENIKKIKDNKKFEFAKKHYLNMDSFMTRERSSEQILWECYRYAPD